MEGVGGRERERDAIIRRADERERNTELWLEDATRFGCCGRERSRSGGAEMASFRFFGSRKWPQKQHDSTGCADAGVDLFPKTVMQRSKCHNVITAITSQDNKYHGLINSFRIIDINAKGADLINAEFSLTKWKRISPWNNWKPRKQVIIE